MRKHVFQSDKFPVADGVIHFFRKMIFNKLGDNKCWIAGGAVTSFLANDRIRDVDLFFDSREAACKVLIILRRDFNFKMHFCTKQAIKGHIDYNGSILNIDIVKRIFSDPIETISEFDFTVCCLAVDQESFYYHENAAFDILRKKLVVNKLPFPVSTNRRMAKYLKRGYSICNGTIMEILTAVRLLDEEDFDLVDFYPID